MKVANSGGPFHLRLVADELAGEPVRRILHAGAIVDTKPANLERHHRRNRRWSAAEERVADVVEVEHVNVGGLQDGVARAGVDAADTVVRNARRPEEATQRDARVEVGDLLSPRTGGVDVNSYERESALSRFAVGAAVDTLHEPHVCVVEGQLDALARRDPRSRDCAVDVGQPDDAV